MPAPNPMTRSVEAEIVRHLQGRGGKVGAIKVSNYVEQEDIGQKPQGNPMASAAGKFIGDKGGGSHLALPWNWPSACWIEM